MNTRLNAGSWYVLAAGIFWGTTGTAQAFAPEGAQPLVVGALRLAVAGTALVPYAFARGVLPSSQRWSFVPLSVAALSMAAYQPLFFGAVATTGVALGTIVAIGSAPVIAGALTWIVSGDQPTSRWVVATALAILGTALLFAGQSEIGVSIGGVALAIGAGAAYAVYVVASKSLLEAHEPDAVIAVVFGLSALMLLPILFVADIGWALTPGGAAAVLYLGLFATSAAYILFVRGLNLLPVGSTVTLSLAEPLTAAALGVILLSERLGLAGALGAVLLLTGLTVIGLRPSRSTKES
ncbi:MAG: DMT family transporter [Anaerolineales bacterium]